MAGPSALFKVMAAMMGLVEKFAPAPDAYPGESLRAIAGVTYIGDNSKAKPELGYSPRSLEAGLAETLRREMKLLGMK